MKFKTSVMFLLLTLACTGNVIAQQATNALENTEELRRKLVEVESKQGELKIRLQQLNEDLKPENIERALAGFGSTRPEDLRSYRRRMLTIEKDSVVVQLNILDATHARLESEIATAEKEAYLRLVQPTPPSANQLSLTGLVPAFYGRMATLYTRILISGFVTIALLGVAVFVARRKRNN
jgi:hypothetical protein